MLLLHSLLAAWIMYWARSTNYTLGVSQPNAFWRWREILVAFLVASPLPSPGLCLRFRDAGPSDGRSVARVPLSLPSSNQRSLAPSTLNSESYQKPRSAYRPSDSAGVLQGKRMLCKARVYTEKYVTYAESCSNSPFFVYSSLSV